MAESNIFCLERKEIEVAGRKKKKRMKEKKEAKQLTALANSKGDVGRRTKSNFPIVCDPLIGQHTSRSTAVKDLSSRKVGAVLQLENSTNPAR